MNVKNKVISIVMSFVIVFGTVSSSFANDKESINNIQPLAVDGGIISVPMLATVSALAVGTGIVIKNSDDIYDLGRMFYDYVKSNNAMTWDMVTGAFAMGVTVKNNLVSVDSNFLDIVKGFFDDKFSNTSEDILIEGIPKKLMVPYTKDTNINFSLGSASIHISYYDNYAINVVISDSTGKVICDYSKGLYLYNTSTAISKVGFTILEDRVQLNYSVVTSPDYHRTKQNFYGDFASVLDNQISFPYTGGYDWGKAEDKKENESIALPIPGNLDNLVGQSADDFWANDKDLVGTNPITKPNVSNPSIDTTDDVFIGSGSSDVPGDTPGIVFPPFGGGLDFSPITQSSFTDKFPFSLGKDIKNIISVFDVEPKAPKFTVPIVSEELEIDLTQFNVWAGIIRFFVLIGFMIALINITRKVIG